MRLEGVFIFVFVMGELFLRQAVTSAHQLLGAGSFVYSREQLIGLQQTGTANLSFVQTLNIPDEIRRRTARGRRAGKKRRGGKEGRRARVRKFKPHLFSLIMGNVRSLENKVDELTALVRNETIFRECSLMCFTETWLQDSKPDTSISIDASAQCGRIGGERKVERGKEEAWWCTSTTGGVILVVLP